MSNFSQIFAANRQNWFWFVGSDKTKVYSSAKQAYIQPNDIDYLLWINAGGVTSTINSEAELWDVINQPLKDQIDALEVGQARTVREMALGSNTVGGDGKTPAQRLAALDAQIATLRGQFKK